MHVVIQHRDHETIEHTTVEIHVWLLTIITSVFYMNMMGSVSLLDNSDPFYKEIPMAV